jgi:hypothetical protein
MKDELFSLQNDRMAGIISPLKTNDRIGVSSQQIDDLSFALIPPLSSNNYHAGHGHLFSSMHPAGCMAALNLKGFKGRTTFTFL